MAKRKQKSKPKPILGRAELLMVRLCLFLALGISIYLAWNSLQGGAIPGCGPESDCDKVLASRWAYIFGLPVSLFAAPVYAALLGLLWRRDLKWPAMVAGSVVILGAAAWFVGIQFFVLRAFCKFCMTAHVAGAIAAVTLLRRNPIATRPTLAWSAAGAAAMALMVAAQFAYTAPQRTEAAYAQNTRSSGETGPAPAEEPVFSVLGGQFKLKLTEVPVHGNIDAPKKVVKLFDYTCHYCRAMHHHFQPLFQKYSNQFAVISLPVPLSAECNYVVKRTSPAHRDACDIAKLGLAVFYADPAKSHAFDAWIFAPQKPPAVPEARRYAEGLVGKENLAKALLDPRIEQRIKEDVDMYVTNSRLARSGKMPQLLFAHGTSIGATTSPQDLEKTLIESMGLGTNGPAPAAAR